MLEAGADNFTFTSLCYQGKCLGFFFLKGRAASSYVEGVNKVRALSLRAAVSDIIFPKSQCCNLETPSAPPLLRSPPPLNGSTLKFCGSSVVRGSAPAHTRPSLDGVPFGIIYRTPYSGAVIGCSRCSYVNEHLVAPAGPAVWRPDRGWWSPRVPGAQTLRGAEVEAPWTRCRSFKRVSPPCRHVFLLFFCFFNNTTTQECLVWVRSDIRLSRLLHHFFFFFAFFSYFLAKVAHCAQHRLRDGTAWIYPQHAFKADSFIRKRVGVKVRTAVTAHFSPLVF